MSLLPQQIIPPNEPIGQLNEAGQVIINKNWWLLLYNLWLNTLGTGIPADQLIALEGADMDAVDSDAIALRRPLANALIQAMQPQDVLISISDLPDLQRALLLAQDGLLPDPPNMSRWTAPTLLNSWTNGGGAFNPAGYTIDGTGRVYLRGFLNAPTTGAGTIIFQLPRAPIFSQLLLGQVFTGTALTPARIDVDTSGNVKLGALYSGTLGSSAWLSLDGISFSLN